MVKEWPVFTIGDILDFKNGLNKGKEFFGCGTPIVNYTDVYHNSGLKQKDIQGKVTLSKEEIRRFEVRKNDVFFTRTSETPDEVGLSAVLLEDIPDCVFSGFVLRGRPKNDWLIGTYCKYCFSTKHIREEIVRNCTYTTRALTNGKVLSAIKIPVPPKPEQEGIADILSSFEQYIADLAELIEKKRGIRDGALEDLISGRTRLAGYEGTWEMVKLKDITSQITKGTTPLDKSGRGTVNFIKVENIDGSSGDITIAQNISVNEHNGYLRRSRLENNDILFSIAGTLGRVAIVDSALLPANTNQALSIIRLKKGNHRFISYYLKSEAIKKYIQENPTVGAQPNLSLKQIGAIVIAFPTENEQEAIADTLTAMDEEIEALEIERDKMIQIREGAMDDLLTGRVRLKGTVV